MEMDFPISIYIAASVTLQTRIKVSIVTITTYHR